MSLWCWKWLLSYYHQHCYWYTTCIWKPAFYLCSTMLFALVFLNVVISTLSFPHYSFLLWRCQMIVKTLFLMEIPLFLDLCVSYKWLQKPSLCIKQGLSWAFHKNIMIYLGNVKCNYKRTISWLSNDVMVTSSTSLGFQWEYERCQRRIDSVFEVPLATFCESSEPNLWSAVDLGNCPYGITTQSRWQYWNPTHSKDPTCNL